MPKRSKREILKTISEDQEVLYTLSKKQEIYFKEINKKIEAVLHDQKIIHNGMLDVLKLLDNKLAQLRTVMDEHIPCTHRHAERTEEQLASLIKANLNIAQALQLLTTKDYITVGPNKESIKQDATQAPVDKYSTTDPPMYEQSR